MPEPKNDGILFLNLKKLITLHIVWKTNAILQYGSLFFIIQLILVRIWRDNLPKEGSAIIKYLIDTVLTTIFGANNFSKISLTHLSNKSRVWLCLYKILFNISLSWWNLKKSERKLKYRINNKLIKPIL